MYKHILFKTFGKLIAEFIMAMLLMYKHSDDKAKKLCVLPGQLEMQRLHVKIAPKQYKILFL